jgi:hypothetical protein
LTLRPAKTVCPADQNCKTWSLERAPFWGYSEIFIAWVGVRAARAAAGGRVQAAAAATIYE